MDTKIDSYLLENEFSEKKCVFVTVSFNDIMFVKPLNAVYDLRVLGIQKIYLNVIQYFKEFPDLNGLFSNTFKERKISQREEQKLKKPNEFPVSSFTTHIT